MKLKQTLIFASVQISLLVVLILVFELFSFGVIHLFITKTPSPRPYDQLTEMTFARKRLFRAHKQVAIAEYTTSEDGFRSDWKTGASPILNYDPDAFNIFAFGGSTTFGTAVQDDETWPAFLEQTLMQKHPNARVYNFGIGGFALHDETYLLTQHLIDGYIPDVAIFYDGVNEDTCPVTDRSAKYREYFENISHPWLVLLKKTNTYQLLDALRARFVGTKTMQTALRNPNLTPQAYETCAESDYFAYVGYITKLEPLFNFKSFFILQPHEGFLEDFSSNDLRTYYEKYYDAVVSKAQEHRAKNLFDRRYVLKESVTSQKGNIFVDWAHLTKTGNMIVAQEILSIIQPSLP